MIEFNLSVSLIKAYNDYLYKGYCGKRFLEVNLKKKHKFTMGEPALLGQYFEFLATGCTPRYGGIPEPIMTKSGSLTSASKRCVDQANQFKQLIPKMGIDIEF